MAKVGVDSEGRRMGSVQSVFAGLSWVRCLSWGGRWKGDTAERWESHESVVKGATW